MTIKCSKVLTLASNLFDTSICMCRISLPIGYNGYTMMENLIIRICKVQCTHVLVNIDNELNPTGWEYVGHGCYVIEIYIIPKYNLNRKLTIYLHCIIMNWTFEDENIWANVKFYFSMCNMTLYLLHQTKVCREMEKKESYPNTTWILTTYFQWSIVNRTLKMRIIWAIRWNSIFPLATWPYLSVSSDKS